MSREHELEHRAEWAFGLDAQLKLNASALRNLQGEFEERSAWALALDRDLQVASRERDELRSEREQILRSLSWHITKPLRFARRKLRGLRVRLGFAASRLRAIVHRTRGSLASRGVVGTMRRATDVSVDRHVAAITEATQVAVDAAGRASERLTAQLEAIETATAIVIMSPFAQIFAIAISNGVTGIERR